MKKIVLTLLTILFITNIFAQSNKKIDYKTLYVIKYQITGIQNNGHAQLLTKRIMSDENNYFCFIDYKKNICYTLSKEKQEINLEIRGSKFTLTTSQAYSDKVFLQIYTASGEINTKAEDNNGELPNYINTGNSFKDDQNYYNIKQIYNRINKGL